MLYLHHVDSRPLARTSDRQTNENELIVRNVSFHLPESLLPKLDVKQSITSEIPAFETIAPIEESVVDVRPTVETDTEQKATADVEPSKHSLSLTDLQSEESDSAQLQIDSELYRRVPNVRLTSLPAQLTLYK